jgi:hypothetical protein
LMSDSLESSSRQTKFLAGIDSPEKLTRVKHRLSPQSVHMPLFGYFTVVGGFLLSMLIIANVFLPATLVDGGSQTHQSKPNILIDSSRKWPERIVYDTSLPTTLALVPVAQEAFRSSPLDSMAQMSAPTAPKQPTHIQVVREKPVKIAKRVSRQKFASIQQQRRPPNLFASWW